MLLTNEHSLTDNQNNCFAFFFFFFETYIKAVIQVLSFKVRQYINQTCYSMHLNDVSLAGRTWSALRRCVVIDSSLQAQKESEQG